MKNCCRVIWICGVLMVCMMGYLQAERSLVVGPTRYDLSMRPGESQTQVIKIVNDGDEIVQVSTLLEDLLVREDGSPYYAPPSDGPSSCANWIRFNPGEFTVAPGDSQVVRFNLTVPSDAVGSRYAVIFFQSLKGVTRGGLGIGSKLGTIIVLDIEGTAPIVGDLTGLTVIPPATVSENYRAMVQMKNDGLAQFKVRGKVVYTDQTTSADVYNQEIIPVNVVPGATRNIAVNGPTVLPTGTYKVTAVVEFNNEIIEGSTALKVE